MPLQESIWYRNGRFAAANSIHGLQQRTQEWVCHKHESAATTTSGHGDDRAAVAQVKVLYHHRSRDAAKAHLRAFQDVAKAATATMHATAIDRAVM